MGRPQTLAVSPFFNLPEPSIANRSTIDPEVVASFGIASRNSATLGFATQNGCRNPKNCELVPIVFRSIIIKFIVENLLFSVENPPFPVEKRHKMKCDRLNPIDKISKNLGMPIAQKGFLAQSQSLLFAAGTA
ncbi:hypothetical protein QT970_02980 [Microcoleus sp. herbarium8]|uniref:hypothetical protein n=1 Tax=Microcoleus sp. herbarium8 TaxID=3055436 RepID=UPI002FD678AB